MVATLAATAAVATGIIITRVGPHNIVGSLQESLERSMVPPAPAPVKVDAAARALSAAAKSHVAAAAGAVQSAAQPQPAAPQRHA